MEEMEEKSLPNYIDLASRIKENTKAIKAKDIDLIKATENQTVAIINQTLVIDELLDSIKQQGLDRASEHIKWCRLQKRRDRIQMLVMSVAFGILATDLYRNEGSVVHNAIRIIKAAF